MGASEHGNFADENLVDEKLLGVVTVTQGMYTILYLYMNTMIIIKNNIPSGDDCL